jgi:hypothetical protein
MPGWTARGDSGQQRRRAWPRQRLDGVSRYHRSGPPNSTRFSPTASWRCKELDSLTLGRQQTTVATGDGEAVQLASGIDTGKLCCSSREDEGTKGGGGLWPSFRDGQFSMGSGTPARQRDSHGG